MKNPFLIIATCGLALGCAGSETPTAETPESPSAAEAPEPEVAAEAESDEAGAEEAASSGPKPTRPPSDILTAPDVVFMFSFKNSDVAEKAEQKCEKAAGGDPQKRIECIRKEQERLKIDDMRFVKDESGDVKWITFRKKGSKLLEKTNLKVDFQDETETSVVVVPRSKGRGKQKIEVPNDFNIAVEHPTHGTLVYEAKIGIVGQE